MRQTILRLMLIALLSIAFTFAKADTHNYVDLGLPSGTLWATQNINTQYYYYTWASTEGRSNRTIATNTPYTTTVYEGDGDYIINELTKYYSGDGKTTLESTDDAATVAWGSEWRMPTKEEFEELINNTEKVFNGSTVTLTGPNGNTITFTAYGFNYGNEIQTSTKSSFYWTSTVWTSTNNASYKCAWAGGFGLPGVGDIKMFYQPRYYGGYIRAVKVEKRQAVQHDYIDLGLTTGTKWATTNIGADNPESYGDYFAWGETSSKDNYSESNYQHKSKYVLSDNKTRLDSSDDAATQLWGAEWRMPTNDEMIELRTQCIWTWTTVNGSTGYSVVGPNGNSIFLPAAGFMKGTTPNDGNTYGHYWSSDVNTNTTNWYTAHNIFFEQLTNITQGGHIKDYGDFHRFYGRSIRAVKVENKQLITSNTAGATVSFSTTGDYEWEYDSANSRLRSTNNGVSSSTSTTTITIVTTKSTNISFDYAVSSESNYDKLTITLDGSTLVNAISGTSSSSYVSSTPLSAGTHTLVVRYAKDSSENKNDDRAYLSNLKLQVPVHTHSYTNGFCSCGDYEQPSLVNNYYLINNAGKLYWFAQQVNTGNTSINGKLTANITVNTNVLTSNGALNGTPSRSWTPIGSSTIIYSGSFDGQDCSISGLYYNNSSINYLGIFGYASGTIQNIMLKDSYLCGSYYVGGIVGDMSGKIKDCVNFATVRGSSYVGGICGYSREILYCCNRGKVVGDGRVGGIVGLANANVYNCSNYAEVSGSGKVGGILGDTYADISVLRCFNSGSVTSSGVYAGGIVGSATDRDYYIQVSSCLNTGAIKGSTQVGGIIGSGDAENAQYSSEISYCCNLGSVSATSSSGVKGSIVGKGEGTKISRCLYDNTKCSSICGQYGTISNVVGKSSFIAGEIAYLLNSCLTSDDYCWYQNIDNGQAADSYPLLDADSHGEVYALPSLDYYSNTPTVLATSITVDKSIETAVGQSLTMSYTINPANATINTKAFKNKNIQAVKWSSANSNIAEVAASTGEVTSKSNGTVDMIASVLDGSAKTATSSVRVYLLGDANGNDKVNIADVATIAAKMNSLSPTNWHFSPANANYTDDIINVADITSTLGIVWNGISYMAPRRVVSQQIKPTKLYAQPITVHPNGESLLSILIDNQSNSFTAFEFEMSLPEGIYIKRDENGNLLANLSQERTTSEKTDYFSVTEKDDKNIYVLCYSSQLNYFEGKQGTVANLTLCADDNVKPGNYALNIDNIVLSGIGNIINCENQEVSISVTDATGVSEIYNEDQPDVLYIYDLSGRIMFDNGKPAESLHNLPLGVYIVNGKKVRK